MDVLEADVAELLPKFSGYEYVPLGLAEPAVSDCVGFCGSSKTVKALRGISFGDLSGLGACFFGRSC